MRKVVRAVAREADGGMKTRICCPKCGSELSTENVLPEDRYVCKSCGEDFYGIEAEDRYFPDDPENKVFTVDAYVPLCKVFKVEAKTGDDAVKSVVEQIIDMLRGVNEMDVGHVLSDNRFHDCEDIDASVSGEADEKGQIGYY